MKTNLNNLKATELKEMAKEAKVPNWWTMKKADLVKALSTDEEQMEIIEVEAEGSKVEDPLQKEIFTGILNIVSGYKEEDLVSLLNIHKGNLQNMLKAQIQIRKDDLKYITKCIGQLKEGKQPNDSIGSIEDQLEKNLIKEEFIQEEIADLNQLHDEHFEKAEPKKKAEPKIDDDNLVTLKDLIIEAKIKGTKARRILRNSDIERPFSSRWEWDQTLHADIIQQVKDLLKI